MYRGQLADSDKNFGGFDDGFGVITGFRPRSSTASFLIDAVTTLPFTSIVT
jgi:hypothetical protein